MPVYETETRGKIRIPATKKENTRAWRDRKREGGERSLNVWLDKDTARRLDALKDQHPDKSKSELIALTIQEFFKKSFPEG